MKTGIIWDLDGTLLDTLGDLTDATNYALAQFGCPPRSLEHIRSIVGNGALRQMTLALPGNADDPDPQAVLAVYKPYYQSHCALKTGPYPGILEALEILAREYPMAIITNKPHATASALCAQHFPGIFAMGETPEITRKPAPDMIYHAMKEIGVERCICIGDSEVDLVTAANAGAPCLTVLWGFRDRADLEKAGARWFCEKAEDLPTMIRSIIEVTYGQ